ncbi:ubinuclein-1 isoform X2 [Bufo gargarizans]|uniref:ubinuclein-1 isoform X2 n=1 Tax=Bufo gargarizans TaxID=30331 RepID=UPI001CF1A330|nr:ubinuclein-1 isoform X2 [Bufo gargarizans]
MAEPRRVQLSSVPRLQPPSPKKPRMEEPDSETSVAATVRIALTLFEPDQKKCPEFFYPELMRKLQRNEKRAEKLDKKPLDPFSSEDAARKEVEALSKKFEEKYGKKRRRDRVQDLVDMGYGYDESDSFIDNSEAYDELVPASLTTKYGGFYINTGTLQFRQASESEDESVREKKKKSPKKMKERGDKVKKRKREEEKKSKKSKCSKPGFTALNGTKEKKKKKLMTNLQEMLARFERDKKAFETWTPMVTATTDAPKTSPSLPPPPPREAEPAPDPLLSTMVPESRLLQAANAFAEKKLESPDPTPEKRSGSPPGEVVKEEFKKPPSVLEGLPPAIEKKIKELAKWVQLPDGDKKIKLFSPQMNAALLDIYLQSRDLSSGQRSSVFSNLSSILPCSKDMLVRWTSRLYLQKKGERLREPLRKLKEAVAKAIPEQIVKYHAELKVHNEARYAKMLSEDKEKEQKTLSEEEEEDKGSKKAAGPRKKFQWTEEIRQLLCQLVRMKVDIYEPGGCGASSLEEYLKSFLDEEVRPLWPRGWMQARTLFRETRRVYPQLRPPMAKNKTVIPPKIRAKESSNKQDKSAPGPSAESQGPAVTTARDSPASVAFAGGSLVSADTQDNSLDGDLIHNPPSLDGVSEHLTALSGRASGLVFEFPAPSKSSGSEKPIMVVEEKKKPCPPVSATITLQPSARPVFHNKFMATGSEKMMMPQVSLPKPASETKQKAPSQHQPGPAKTQAANPVVQSSVKVYQMSNQATKGSFTHPIQSGGAKVSAPSPSQQPLTPQTKPVKPQGIPPSSSPSGTSHKPVVPLGFIVKTPSNPGLVGAQVYRGAINRLPAPPHGNTSGQKPTTTLNQPPTSASRNPTTTLNQPPTSASRNPTTTLNQPPTSASRNPTATLNQPPTSASRNPTTTLNQPPTSASRNPTTTLNQPPTSSSRNPTTTLNQPPTSASRNPTATLNQPPTSASRNPTTTLNQPPTSASRNPTTTLYQPPTSASRNPTTTLNQPPTSASRNPNATLNQLPTSASRNPTATLNQPPTSASRNPTATLNQPPTSASRNPTATLNQPPTSASRNPTATLNQPPTSASRNPTATLNQPPTSASRNPTATLNQPPTSASRNPTATLNQPPTSASRNPTATLNQPPTSASRNTTTTLNQPPTSASRNTTTMSTKKPPPQKLTLMAPQSSGGGTQGVAKLLTSSMVAGGGNATSIVSSQKGSAAPGLLGPAPLTILTSSYKQNGVRMPAPAALGLLSPITTFPLHVVSFTTDPPPKARASKDAIVTGPAPGTFNHGLQRSILGGLHTSTGHPSTPIPHQAVSGHMQPAQTDGTHTHSKGTVPSQMRPGRPNNP